MKKKKRVKVYHKMEVHKKYFDDIARGIMRISFKSLLAFAILLLLIALSVGTLVSGKLRARNAEKYYRLGLRHEEMGDGVAARVEYRKVLELDGGHSGALLAIGKIELRDGLYLAAIHRFNRILEEEPPSAEVLTLMASALLGRGETEKAAECLKRALAIDPEFGEASEMLAAVTNLQKGP